MTASPAADLRYAADRAAYVGQATSMPGLVTHRRLSVGESPTAVQFAGGPPPLQLHHVPSPAAAAVDVLADAFHGPSNGSSTLAGYGCAQAAAAHGVAVPAAPTRRSREFIPESKKDDEYWMKRQKNNEAASRRSTAPRGRAGAEARPARA